MGYDKTEVMRQVDATINEWVVAARAPALIERARVARETLATKSDGYFTLRGGIGFGSVYYIAEAAGEDRTKNATLQEIDWLAERIVRWDTLDEQAQRREHTITGARTMTITDRERIDLIRAGHVIL